MVTQEKKRGMPHNPTTPFLPFLKVLFIVILWTTRPSTGSGGGSSNSSINNNNSGSSYNLRGCYVPRLMLKDFAHMSSLNPLNPTQVIIILF